MIQRIVRKIYNPRLRNQWHESPPYDHVQNITEFNIHSYIGVSEFDIRCWCIVGGYLGLEVPRILHNYPNVEITVFECSKRYVEQLKKSFATNKKVRIIDKAVTNRSGNIEFHETSLQGSGSLLELGEFHKQSYNSTQAESFTVESTTLDDVFGSGAIDVLQIDVQGAEKLVLEGASNVLLSTKAIFIETSVFGDLYQESVTFDELYIFLKNLGFVVALIGTDFNLTGNALFLNSRFRNS